MVELTFRERFKVVVKRLLALGFLFSGGAWFCRRLAKPAVLILVYHRIIKDDEAEVWPYISVTAEKLRRQIRYLKRRYTVIALDEAVERLRAGTVNQNYLVFTFDDGYADNYFLGLPIFKSEQVFPAVFVTTDCVEYGEPLWPDLLRRMIYSYEGNYPIELPQLGMVLTADRHRKITAVKNLIAYGKKLDSVGRKKFLDHLAESLGAEPSFISSPMLDWTQVKQLSREGVTIGSHTMSHPVLANVADEVAADEIIGSKQILETKINQKVKYFAFPNGTESDFTANSIVHLQTAGYVAAVTTVRGVNRPGCDLFRLRRTGVYVTDNVRDIEMKLAVESLLN